MTDEEKEQKEAQLIRDFLTNATPEQRHLFIARSNYDSNYDALNELTADPQLDRASALLMYWSLGAAWYVQYGHDDDVPDYSRQTLALIRLIETRYSAGFYADHGIWFDPMQSEGGRPDDYPDLPVRRPVPDIMLIAAPGDVYVDLDDDHYDDGLPLPLAEQLYALYE